MPSALENLRIQLVQGALPTEIFRQARNLEAHGLTGENDESALIDIYQGCLGRGLTYAKDPGVFLEASQRLSRLLFRYGREREANNYLLYLRDLSGETAPPPWVWSYTAKLEYTTDLDYSVRCPKVVLAPLAEAFAVAPGDTQAGAVLADFVVSASTWLLEREDHSGAALLSDSLERFLEEYPTARSSTVKDRLNSIAKLAESDHQSVATDGERRSDFPAAPRDVKSPASLVLFSTRISSHQHRAPKATSADLAAARREIVRLQRELDRVRRENTGLRKGLLTNATGDREPLPHSGPPVSTPQPQAVLGRTGDIDGSALPPRTRILVLGDSQVPEQRLAGICKQYGLLPQQVEFVLGYEAFNRMNFQTLRYNGSIAGILIGPVPHKVPGCDDPANVLQTAEGFPPTVKVETSSGELKITKSAFRLGLERLLVRIAANEPLAFRCP